MARRTSPLVIKQQLANAREAKALERPRRDDGELRRSDKEPIEVQAIRELSRERKFHVPKHLAQRLELAYQARLGRERGEYAVTLRRQLLGV